jgi:hypothetical protein
MATIEWSRSRKMIDYRQPSQSMNCGGVAAVFALYGRTDRVPESIDGVLQESKVPAARLGDLINKGQRGISATTLLYGMDIAVSGGPRRLEFLEGFSEPDITMVAIADVLDTNDLRCLILSCNTVVGPHWQTFYKPGKSGALVHIFNPRLGWRPMLFPLGMTPTGAILVKGPAIL